MGKKEETLFGKDIRVKMCSRLSMARSRCMGPRAGTGTRQGTMNYYIFCRTLHTAPGPGTAPDQLSPIVPVPLPVPVPFLFPFLRSVNMP